MGTALEQALAQHGELVVKAVGITNQREHGCCMGEGPVGRGAGQKSSGKRAERVGLAHAFRCLYLPAGRASSHPEPLCPAAGETTIVWDRETGQPLHNAIVWLDNRTAPVCVPALRRSGRLRRRLPAPCMMSASSTLGQPTLLPTRPTPHAGVPRVAEAAGQPGLLPAGWAAGFP